MARLSLRSTAASLSSSKRGAAASVAYTFGSFCARPPVPNGKGHYEVKFSIAPWGGGFDLTVTADTWRSLQPLVAEIYAANR